MHSAPYRTLTSALILVLAASQLTQGERGHEEEQEVESWRRGEFRGETTWREGEYRGKRTWREERDLNGEIQLAEEREGEGEIERELPGETKWRERRNNVINKEGVEALGVETRLERMKNVILRPLDEEEKKKEEDRNEEEGVDKRREAVEEEGKKREEEEEEVAWIWVTSTTSTHQQTTTTATRQLDRIEGPATNLTLEIRTHTHTLVLDLYANKELLGHTYKGPRVTEKQGWCAYLGKVRGDPASMVAVSVCGGLTGILFTDGRWVEVQPASPTHTLAGPHLLHTHRETRQDMNEVASTCGVRGEKKKKKKVQKPEQNATKSSALDRVRRSLRGDYLWVQPNTSFVEVVVVVDATLRNDIENATKANADSDTTEERITKRVQAIMNIVNGLYQPLGVKVVLTHLEIWDKDRVKVVDKNSNDTLDNFKKYLATFKAENPDIPTDNMQLLTGVTFEGNTVGKGTVGGMCGPSSVGVSMGGPKRSVMGVAETVTHEMGHNFGLNHVDEVPDCECKEKNCIMLSSGIGKTWDECSVKNVSRLLPTLVMECLRNRPPAPPLGSCGNGVVDGGEECDCGPPQNGFCNHTCCEPSTCKLAPNATCGTGPCCDFKTCRPHKLSPPVQCRRAAHSTCDVAEYCNGRSEFCPPDSWASDGTACEVGKGYCYHGACGSSWGRCVLVWGEGATPCTQEQHEHYNTQGDSIGNCGYEDRDQDEMKACYKEDAECGTLLCRTPKQQDALGWFFHRMGWIGADMCRAVVANKDYDPSAWLVPNGAACGDGKMCVDQHCVSRPTPLSTIIFWVVVVISAVLTLLCWDHFRYCWERKGGRECCHTHLYYCAACLDCCCCPCMNRLNRLVLAVLPPLSAPKCDCVKIPVRGASKDTDVEMPNGEVVCNGSGPTGDTGPAARPQTRQERVDVSETPDEWRVKNFVKFAPKGVTLKPISPKPEVRPQTQASHSEVPLLTPLFEPPQPNPSSGNWDSGQFSNVTDYDMGADSRPDLHTQSHTHTHIAPVRPAPPPPKPHIDTHMDPHTDSHRPTPSVPPRPVITHPLRPPLPPNKPVSPLSPPVTSPPPASFPSPPPPSSSSSSAFFPP